MSFLAGLGTKAEARRLRPFMRADEHYLECDILDVTAKYADEPASRRAGNQVVSLTSHAIYMRPAKAGGFEAIRLPYARIIDLQSKGPYVTLSTKSAGYLFAPVSRGRPMIADLYKSLASHLKRLEKHSQVVDVPGGQVITICRPVEENGEPVWLLVASEEVDLQAPDVRSSLEAALTDPIARYGPLRP